jgi:hypothetical protein
VAFNSQCLLSVPQRISLQVMLWSATCQFRTLALGDEKVSKAIVLKSGLGPGQKHDLTAEAAEIDAGVDLARGRERQTVDNYGMDGAVAK